MQIIFQPRLIFIALLIMSGMYAHINGLQCFQCQMTNSSSDSCLTFGNTPVYCTKSHCTIFRYELQDPEWKIIDFQRGCEDAQSYLNKTVITSTSIKYYQYCSEDLCNGDNGGLQDFITRGASVNGSKNNISSSNGIEVIEVPGVGYSWAGSMHFDCYFSITVATLISTIMFNGNFSVLRVFF